jgi:hypothetical protein
MYVDAFVARLIITTSLGCPGLPSALRTPAGFVVAGISLSLSEVGYPVRRLSCRPLRVVSGSCRAQRGCFVQVEVDCIDLPQILISPAPFVIGFIAPLGKGTGSL